MTNRKWLLTIGILIVVAAVCLYLKGWLIRGEVVVSPSSESSRKAALDKGLPSLSWLVKATKPSVVNISTTTLVRGMGTSNRSGNFREFFGDEFFDKFFGDAPTKDFKQRSLGSGFIIDEEGYILTNNHVVEKASSIRVKLSDDKEYDAKVIGRDAKTDIALIKISPKNNLPAATLGDSDRLDVGDWVVAVGNPYGLDHTVTVGIVSAKGRIIGQGPYDDFIQTDASINPGNSGGPLFNLRGEVVGINSAIISGGQGIGFAVPVNIAKSLLAQLKSKGKVVRGWLGVVIQKVTPELAKTFGLKGSEGALVADIMDNSPASRGDLRRGDVIVFFDGKPIRDIENLPRTVAATEVGKKVMVGLVRDGKRIDINVTVAEAAEEEREVQGSAPEVEKHFGLVVQNITPEIARHLDLKDRRGVIVTDIHQGSPAEDADIRAGDVVKEINRKPVTNVADFRAVLAKAKPRDGVVMLVKRDNASFYAVVREEKGKW